MKTETETIVAIEGAFTNDETGSVTHEGNLYIRGNWVNDGSFLSETGKATFWGSNQQNISGTETTNFFNADMNNENGITLSQDITISGILNLTDGLVTTDSNEVFIVNTSSYSIDPYSESEYIVGNLRRNVNNNGSYFFPIGTAENYELAEINFLSVSGITNILSCFTNSLPNPAPLPAGLNVNGTPVTDMLNYGYWTLTPDAPMTSGSYTVTLNEKGSTNDGLSADRYCVLKRENSISEWQSMGTHYNYTQSVNGYTVTAQRSALSGFSEFGIGFTEEGFPLPLELIFFKATGRNFSVDLNWTTFTEDNTDYFLLERSSDAIHYSEIFKISAAGQSNNILNYHATDFNPIKGVSYYRIKLVKKSGIVSDSLIDDVFSDKNEFTVSVFPNPAASNNINLHISGAVKCQITVTLIDAKGVAVFEKNITPETDNYNLKLKPANTLTAGYYLIELKTGEKKYSLPLIVQ